MKMDKGFSDTVESIVRAVIKEHKGQKHTRAEFLAFTAQYCEDHNYSVTHACYAGSLITYVMEEAVDARTN